MKLLRWIRELIYFMIDPQGAMDEEEYKEFTKGGGL